MSITQWGGLLSFVCVLFLIGLGPGASQPRLQLEVLSSVGGFIESFELYS